MCPPGEYFECYFVIKINDIIKQLFSYVHGSLHVDNFWIYCARTNMSFVEKQFQVSSV